MGDELADGQDVEMTVRNIGGIDETSMQISSGVTALVGENATNRTSLVQAIAAGLGTDSYTLKSDADAGEVSLTVGERTYVRQIRRENGHLETEGDTYLDDPDVAELYAVLLESNPVRRAVRRGEDLRDLILAPVDTEEITERIGQRVDERREIDSELDRLDVVEEELDDLRAERARTADRLAEIEEQLDAKRAALAETERDEPPPEEDELDGRLSELREARTELEAVTANLESERRSVESLRETLATVQQQYESLSVPEDAEIATVEERIEGLRERRRSLDATISDLQQVIRFNEAQLNEPGAAFGDALEGADDGQSVADGLNPTDATVTCWTCGSRVEHDSIEGTIERLREIRQEKTREKNRIVTELEELEEKLDGLEGRQAEYAELGSRLQTLEGKIERAEENIERFERRRERLRERVADLEAEIESLQASRQDELLTLQGEISRLEFEAEQVEAELDRLDAEIEDKEAELDAREDLAARRETVSAELRELRTRVERVEREAIEEFNTHMAALIDELGYDNVERIWIERTEAGVAEDGAGTTEATFDLHVVRTNAAGEAYEDAVEHLSESEREVVGLVVALAGYLVHDVHEEVPFMLLDSIEMIDGDRLVDLVGYLESYVPYLLVVLLPDHARAFEGQPPASDYRTVEV